MQEDHVYEVTKQLLLLRQYDLQIQPQVRYDFWRSKSSICYHFLLMQAAIRQNSISDHILLACGQLAQLQNRCENGSLDLRQFYLDYPCSDILNSTKLCKFDQNDRTFLLLIFPSLHPRFAKVLNEFPPPEDHFSYALLTSAIKQKSLNLIPNHAICGLFQLKLTIDRCKIQDLQLTHSTRTSPPD